MAIDSKGRFRLPKLEAEQLFDGQPHLLCRGTDFPDVMADSDVCHRLRNAAYYRKLKVTLAPTPQGILVHAQGNDKVNLANQLIQALRDRDDLKEALNEVCSTLEASVKALEQEVSLMKEELSTLKTQ
jgi:hypothetical protein